MLLAGTMLMGFWLYLVGGLQARFGHWGTLADKRTLIHWAYTYEILTFIGKRSGLWKTMKQQPKPSLFAVTSLFAGVLFDGTPSL